jgi:hypothetical protein
VLRSVEVQLLVGSAGAGAVAAAMLLRRRGVVVVPLGLGLAAAVNELFVDAFPSSISVPARYLAASTAAAIILAAAGGWPWRPASGPGWLAWPLPLVAGLGVYAGVPETSYALLVLGVIAGIAVVGLTVRHDPGPGLCAGLAAAPVLGVVFGSVAIPQAFVGGVLACTPGLLLGFVVPPRSWIRGAIVVGLAGVTSLIAARGLAVERTWDDAGAVVAAVVVLNGLALVVDRWRRQAS